MKSMQLLQILLCLIGLLMMSPGSASGSTPSKLTFSVLKDIDPGSLGSHPVRYTAAGNREYFTARTAPGSPFELWVTNGTTDGTIQLTKEPTEGDPAWDMQSFRAGLFFVMSIKGEGEQLWFTDGTVAGTRVVRPSDPNICPCEGFTAYDNKVVFIANFPREQPWITDGTEIGTHVLDGAQTGPTSAAYFTLMNGELYFLANGGGSPTTQLWKTDGTSAGTTQVTANIPDISDRMVTVDLLEGGPTLFFTTFDGDSQGIWRSDGTASGTKLVKSLGSGAQTSVQDMVAYNHELVFDGDDGVSGDEPWRSDGTAAGTAMLADVTPGSHGTYWQDPTLGADGVYFGAFDGKLYRVNDGNNGWTVSPVATTSVADPWMLTDGGMGLVFYDYTGGYGKERLAGLTYAPQSAAYLLPNVTGVRYKPVSWAVNNYQSIAYNPTLGLIFGVLQVKGYGPEPVVGRWS